MSSTKQTIKNALNALRDLIEKPFPLSISLCWLCFCIKSDKEHCEGEGLVTQKSVKCNV